MDNNEWSLHRGLFEWLLTLGVLPEVDLFASPCNHKMPRYYSRFRDPQAYGIDALSDQWKFQKAYAFPPVPVILQFLRRLRTEKVVIIAVIPFWPNRPWFPLLSLLSYQDPVPLPLRRGSTVSRHDVTPMPILPTHQGVVLEREKLESLGCPEEAIPTLLSARRGSTNRVYECIWSKFTDHMSSRSNPCNSPAVQDILSFLQSGLDLSLAVSSLRVQVSAISAFTEVSWANHSLICQFFKGAIRLKPQRRPRFPKWDLPIVLDFLSNLGLDPDEPLSMRDLTLKTTFLVAVTSAKRVSEIRNLGSEEPFLTFFPDRVSLDSHARVKP